MDLNYLNSIVARHKDFALATREHLHRYPELGNQEFKTSTYLQEALGKAGIEYRTIPGMTGLVGLIHGSEPGQVVALRADMDALPIQEESSKPYASQNKGVMHACGHDAHTAILLGTALALHDSKDNLRGTVKLIFQPAEEGIGGAERMIAAGCMDKPRVDYVFGLHVDPTLPTGKVQSRGGVYFSASDSYDLIIRGKKAHGAKPHTGHDAIVALSSIVLEIQTIVSRRVSPLDSAVITIGKVEGGTIRNVIADEARLYFTVRTLGQETRQLIREILPKMIEHACLMHGVEGEIHHKPGYDAVINEPNCVNLIQDVANKLLGEDAFINAEFPTMRSEDFSYYSQRAPGAYYEIGCRNEVLGLVAETHNSQFDIDPATIKVGMLMQAGLVLSLLGKNLK